ncbi:MAG: LPXTG cell wall anchor domain-containing protein [Paenibacillaceae bacterium]|nr:LPXTG cell wall anchor domain-containing protein [Paenibacillaceae bacterium]
MIQQTISKNQSIGPNIFRAGRFRRKRSAESQSEAESQAGNQEETSQNSPAGILAVLASVCAIIGFGGIFAYRKKRK